MQLKLSEIHVDPGTTTRPLKPYRVAYFQEQIGIGVAMEPLWVCKMGGQWWLVAGQHRFEALRRAYGGIDPMVDVVIVECQTATDMILKSIEENHKHGLPYDENDRHRLWNLLRDKGVSRKVAMQALGLSDDHVKRYDDRIVTMPATDTKAEKRATSAEEPIDRERVISTEATSRSERANANETPNIDERVISTETPSDQEQTTCHETPDKPEPDAQLARSIRFHLKRLRELLPPDWAEVSVALEMLCTEVERKLSDG